MTKQYPGSYDATKQTGEKTGKDCAVAGNAILNGFVIAGKAIAKRAVITGRALKSAGQYLGGKLKNAKINHFF